MTTSVLATGTFWRDLLERAGRQAAQTALPIVAAIGAAGTISPQAVAVAIAGAVLFTVIKALVTIKYTPGEDVVSALLDRAVPAAAGTVLGMVPVDTFNILAVDWSAVFWAAGAAAVVAMLAYYVTPPVVEPTPVDPPLAAPTAADGPLEDDEVL